MPILISKRAEVPAIVQCSPARNRQNNRQVLSFGHFTSPWKFHWFNGLNHLVRWIFMDIRHIHSYWQLGSFQLAIFHKCGKDMPQIAIRSSSKMSMRVALGWPLVLPLGTFWVEWNQKGTNLAIACNMGTQHVDPMIEYSDELFGYDFSGCLCV